MRTALLSVLMAVGIVVLIGCAKKKEPKKAGPKKPTISQEEIDRAKATEQAMQRKMEAEAMADIKRETQAGKAEQARRDRAAMEEIKSIAKEAETTLEEGKKAVKDAKTPPKKEGKAEK